MSHAIYRAVIFDLDGTLADTLADIGSSMNRVLENRGLPVHPVQHYKYMIGKGLENLVIHALPSGNREAQFVADCLAEFRDDYNMNCLVKTRLYDGIVDVLFTLRERQFKVSVFSNKAEDLTRTIVQALLPGFPFETVIGARKDLPRKPDPAGALLICEMTGVKPRETLYVGDSDVDMITANAAGMVPLGALWGFRTREELQAHGARFFLKEPAELLLYL